MAVMEMCALVVVALRGAMPKPGHDSAGRMCDAGRFASTGWGDHGVRHRRQGGWTACVKCPKGQYQPGQGRSRCKFCPFGRYQPLAGTSHCLRCPGARYSLNDKTACARAVRDCPPGSAPVRQDRAGDVYYTCGACPISKYQARTLHIVPIPSLQWYQRCQSCPPGKYTQRTASSSCLTCPAGQSRAVRQGRGSLACTHCPLGQSTSRGDAHCTRCAPGQFGYKRPAPHTHTALRNSTLSVRAPAGAARCARYDLSCLQLELAARYKRSRARAQVGTSTGTGQRRLGRGSAHTVPRPRAPTPAATQARCKRCPAGQFQSESGQLSCRPCTEGTVAAVPGLARCQLCPPGKFQLRSGGVKCIGVVVSTRRPTAHPTPSPTRAPTSVPTPVPPSPSPTPTPVAAPQRKPVPPSRAHPPHVSGPRSAAAAIVTAAAATKAAPQRALSTAKAPPAAIIEPRSSIGGTKWLALHVLLPLSSLLLLVIAAMTLRAQREHVADADIHVDDGVDLLQLNEQVYHTYQNVNENVDGFTATVSGADGMSSPEGETYREFVLGHGHAVETDGE